MEISLTQCILIGLWTGVCITGMLTGTYLTRCLVLSFGVGLILGDMETGLLMGAAGELAFLGFGVSSGGSVPPNPVGPGVIGAILAVTMKNAGMDTGTALACSFPFAVLIQFLITGIYTLTTGLVPMAEKTVDEGRYGKFRLMANSTFLLFVLAGFLIGFLAAFQADGLRMLILRIPERLTSGLGTAGKMLPAIGFAVILNVMADREAVPFVLIGYVLAAFLKMPVVGTALLAAALAWMTVRGEAGRPGKPAVVCRDIPVGNSPGGQAEYRPDAPSASQILSDRRMRRLTRRTALRAYFLQNGYNYGNYEGLGYGAIVFPALRKLCPDEESFRRELKDSIGYCSVNPNFLPILTDIHLIGINRGISGSRTRDIRTALMGPLAGIGDSLVQFCIAPVLSTLGAAMAREGSPAGPLVFLAGMNVILLSMKLGSEALGFQVGTALTEKLRDCLEPISRASRMAGTAVITGLVVTCVEIRLKGELVRGGRSVFCAQDFLDQFLPGILPLLFTGLLFWLIKKKNWSMYRLAAVTLLFGIAGGLAGILA